MITSNQKIESALSSWDNNEQTVEGWEKLMNEIGEAVNVEVTPEDAMIFAEWCGSLEGEEGELARDNPQEYLLRYPNCPEIAKKMIATVKTKENNE